MIDYSFGLEFKEFFAFCFCVLLSYLCYRYFTCMTKYWRKLFGIRKERQTENLEMTPTRSSENIEANRQIDSPFSSTSSLNENNHFLQRLATDYTEPRKRSPVLPIPK